MIMPHKRKSASFKRSIMLITSEKKIHETPRQNSKQML